MKDKSQIELEKKVAELERKVEYLEKELEHISDYLNIKIGMESGMFL